MSRRLCKYCTLCKVKHSADHKKKKWSTTIGSASLFLPRFYWAKLKNK